MRLKITQIIVALGLSVAAGIGFAGTQTSSNLDTGVAHQNQKPLKAETKHKVLVVMTNHSKYPSRDEATGLWLTELTHFYEVFNQAGIPMDFVSPKGGNVPLDERSLGWLYRDKNAMGLLTNPSFANKLRNSKAAATVNAADYDVIFFTGGHGTMWDFRDNQDLKRLAEGIYQNGGIVSSVCHGAAGLLNLENKDGTPLIAQRRVTGFSNFEEKLSGIESQVPFALQTEMEKRNARYEKSFLPFGSHVVTDGRLVTGQNPGSSQEVAHAVLQALKNLR
jgi:putative intracellular protease/amidase